MCDQCNFTNCACYDNDFEMSNLDKNPSHNINQTCSQRYLMLHNPDINGADEIPSMTSGQNHFSQDFASNNEESESLSAYASISDNGLMSNPNYNSYESLKKKRNKYCISEYTRVMWQRNVQIFGSKNNAQFNGKQEITCFSYVRN